MQDSAAWFFIYGRLFSSVLVFPLIIIRSLLINRLRKSVIVFLWKLSLLSLSFPLSLRVIQMDKVSSRLTNPAMPRIETELDIAQAALHTSCQSSVQIPVLKLIWLAGAVVLASFFVISYIRCRQRFSAAESFTYGYLPEFLKRCALKRTVTVKVTDAVTSPMTYGIIRPVILLPKNLDIQNKEQLGYTYSFGSTLPTSFSPAFSAYHLQRTSSAISLCSFVTG